MTSQKDLKIRHFGTDPTAKEIRFNIHFNKSLSSDTINMNYFLHMCFGSFDEVEESLHNHELSANRAPSCSFKDRNKMFRQVYYLKVNSV